MDAARNTAPALVFADGYSYTEFFLAEESAGPIFTRVFHAMLEPDSATPRRSEPKPHPSKVESL